MPIVHRLEERKKRKSSIHSYLLLISNCSTVFIQNMARLAYRKKYLDPNAPKKPHTAWQIFSSEKREEISVRLTEI